jgi:acyl dehydratase
VVTTEPTETGPWVEPAALAKIGHEIRHYVCDPVSMRSIREYCAGTDDWNPLYWDESSEEAQAHGGVIAPPLFFLAVARRVVPRDQLREDGQHRDLGVEGVHGRSVQATQDLEMGAPVRPGDVLTVREVLDSIEEKMGRSGKLVIVSMTTTCMNQDGVVAAVVKAQWIFR